MKIRIERSGGITGIPFSTEFDEEDLPSILISQVKKMFRNKNASSIPMKRTPQGSADSYVYKISMGDGENMRTIVCDEYNLDDDLKSIIKQMQKHSKNEL